jgi:hypothetical protein
MAYPFGVSLFDAGYIIVTLSMPSIEGAAPGHRTRPPRSGDDELNDAKHNNIKAEEIQNGQKHDAGESRAEGNGLERFCRDAGRLLRG